MRVPSFNHPVSITVEAPLKPSEDVEKVKEAVMNLTRSKLEVQQEDERIMAQTEDERCLYNIYEQVRSRQTMGVARRLLLEHSVEETTWLHFNKQAALMGVVSVCEEEGESPLGPVKLVIRSSHLHELIEWLAPG